MNISEFETAEAERWLLGVAGELSPLLGRHKIDKRGRCRVCREVRFWWLPWPVRVTCTVRDELRCSLRHLDWLAPSIIASSAGEFDSAEARMGSVDPRLNPLDGPSLTA